LIDESTPSSIRTVIVIPAGTVKGAALATAAATTHTKMIAPVIRKCFIAPPWTLAKSQYNNIQKRPCGKDMFSQVQEKVHFSPEIGPRVWLQ
jgi:hypothetical protein